LIGKENKVDVDAVVDAEVDSGVDAEAKADRDGAVVRRVMM
jgi:hypothetical protein